MVAVETLQVRPTMVLLYDTYIDRPSLLHRLKYDKRGNLANINRQAYSGTLAPHAKKRLAKALNLLVAIARPKSVFNPKTGKPFTFRLNFVTLTLPAAQKSISDKDLKIQCFDPFIKSMKRKHGLKSYIWRAERQFNGNLHFHLTTDCFLPLTSLRDEWNRFLARFHFIDDFEKKHGHFSPNSTDVHSVHQIKNIAAYMVKYMSKDPVQHLADVNSERVNKGLEAINPNKHEYRSLDHQPQWNTPIVGKVWDCSINLKTKEKCVMVADSHTRSEVRHINASGCTEHLTTDHCFLMLLKSGRMEEVLPTRLRHMYQGYLNKIRNFKRLPRTPLDIEPDPFFGYRERNQEQMTLAFSRIPQAYIVKGKTKERSS